MFMCFIYLLSEPFFMNITVFIHHLYIDKVDQLSFCCDSVYTLKLLSRYLHHAALCCRSDSEYKRLIISDIVKIIKDLYHIKIPVHIAQIAIKVFDI